ADRRRDHGSDRGDDAPHGRADAPVDVGHGRNPPMNEGKAGDIEQLLPRFGLDHDSSGPGLDRDRSRRGDDIVDTLAHGLTSLIGMTPAGAPTITVWPVLSARPSSA